MSWGDELWGDVTYVVVATRSPQRYFDLDAVRVEHLPESVDHRTKYPLKAYADSGKTGEHARKVRGRPLNPAGAPPLDWHIDNPDDEHPPPKEANVTVTYHVGDVFDVMAKLPDNSVDLFITSPPFLALRDYLPADHPDKHKEIGNEANPADFIDTLLALTAEWDRLLAPHGSICVELGDTYSGSGGAGGDYDPGGMRSGQPKFRQGTPRWDGRPEGQVRTTTSDPVSYPARGAHGWPLAKSLCGIPHAYQLSLIYGWNVLRRNAPDSPAGRWRARNYISWARPNPPVGALGDKFRPATSYITVACRGTKRYFDLDAVRYEAADQGTKNTNGTKVLENRMAGAKFDTRLNSNPAGAPPLDWHSDMPDEDGDWLWKLATAPYKGSHYATFPETLPRRLIEAMCPQRVCTVCGKPSERIVSTEQVSTGRTTNGSKPRDRAESFAGTTYATRTESQTTTLGWSDCGHNNWRIGHVLDPFGGSGTTGAAAIGIGRDATLIDLDESNLHLARERCGMFLEEAS